MKAVFIFSALSGFLSVLMGAIGDHAIASSLQNRWDVAQEYHQIYSLVLLALTLYGLITRPKSVFFKTSLISFMCGLILFCSSLYLSITLQINQLTVLTPLGGTAFMVGWLSLATYAITLNLVSKE